MALGGAKASFLNNTCLKFNFPQESKLNRKWVLVLYLKDNPRMHQWETRERETRTGEEISGKGRWISKLLTISYWGLVLLGTLSEMVRNLPQNHSQDNCGENEAPRVQNLRRHSLSRSAKSSHAKQSQPCSESFYWEDSSIAHWLPSLIGWEWPPAPGMLMSLHFWAEGSTDSSGCQESPWAEKKRSRCWDVKLTMCWKLSTAAASEHGEVK